ncbi:MAG: hypothetical protein EKK53_18845 [Burkholderiales bacterium]|nr:MAG: hypothetical protein EKK53_18845 [Burkholderiales bacterium]
MSAAPVGFESLLARMPRWFVEHARKTAARGRRRRAAQQARFELAFSARVTPRQAGAPIWHDTVCDARQH